MNQARNELYMIIWRHTNTNKFKLGNENIDAATATQEPVNATKISDKREWKILLDIFIALALCIFLFYAVSYQMFKPRTDAGRYQCYALVFWKGIHGIDSLPPQQCAFLKDYSPATIIKSMKSRDIPAGIINLAESQSPSEEPLHTLPYEYPLLSLVPFSLGLVAPTSLYQVAFAIWMLLVVGIIYFVLKKTRSSSAAIAYSVYLVLGCWATAATRFDLVPAALMLGAIILAARAKWHWGFALLAMATLLKFYPVVLVVPFLIAQQTHSGDQWYSWRRWSALGMYMGICVVVTFSSLVLNIADTLSPLDYFLNRPIQIESVPATLLWLGSFFGYPLQFIHSFGSVNITSPLSHRVALLSLLCLGVGLLYTFWLQWRGKLDISTASLLTLLIILITGKVFSPQYLIWIVPPLTHVLFLWQQIDHAWFCVDGTQ